MGLEVTLEGDGVRFGTHVTVLVQRTLRIPEKGGPYPLPPSLGSFPLRRVEDFGKRVPLEWRRRGGLLLPMYQREALWLSFDGDWKPHALQVGIGRIDALTGEAWTERLSAEPQNYAVIPDQPWLDGINSGHDTIRQFVAMPLGGGYTVEGQVSGEEVHGGLQLRCVAPKTGRFRKPASRGRRPSDSTLYMCCAAPSTPAEMGLGAGGEMRQSIYPDRNGLDTWNEENSGRVWIHIVNSSVWREITGEDPPPTPVTVREYTRFGLPWFDLYDDHLGDLDPAEKLENLKTISAVDHDHGLGTQQDDTPFEADNVPVITHGSRHVTDGGW